MKDAYSSDLLNTVQTYQQVTREGRLLQIDFTTLVDYLHLLRACSLILATVERRALLYLAAAVSDFYIPRDKMVILIFTKSWNFINHLKWDFRHSTAFLLSSLVVVVVLRPR